MSVVRVVPLLDAVEEFILRQLIKHVVGELDLFLVRSEDSKDLTVLEGPACPLHELLSGLAGAPELFKDVLEDAFGGQGLGGGCALHVTSP